MKPLLLDSHVLLWWLTEPKRLSRRAHALIERGDAVVSVVTLWELLHKQGRRKLKLPQGDLETLIAEQSIRVLSLQVKHVTSAASLNNLHADPFDLLLIGVARVERMVLLTHDRAILELAAPILGDLLMEA